MRTLIAVFAVFAVFALLACFAPVPARADVVPPEEAACQAGAKGGKCTVREAGEGTCQDSTCGHLDYTRDASTPGSTTTPCLKCLDEKGQVPTAKPGAGGCSQATWSPTSRELGALLFAGAFSLLVVFRRRRPSGS
jgi:hypothetical protein